MIRDFEVADVPAAGALLLARHQTHRVAVPLLSPLDLERAMAAVRELFDAPGASGAVAVDGGVVAGYVLGVPKSGKAWGPNMWIEAAGCAGSPLQELWAFAATGWLADGRPAQYALVPPLLVPAFTSLGFGTQQVHAAKTTREYPADARVRRAEVADVPVLAELDVIFDEHLAAAPVFSAAGVTPYQEALRNWQEGIVDPAYAAFVAVIDGVVVGSAVGCDVSKSAANRGLPAPAPAAFLGFAAVLPSFRGRGLGRALGQAVECWAFEQRYPTICTDWRSTNLPAAHAWPALGYEQTFVRLHRLVGF